MIWFNSPFSMNVTMKVGKTFLRLLQGHLPKLHPMHKLFNRNKVKRSYCCMKNMKSAISSHSKQSLNPTKEYFGCNCRVKDECPLDIKCLTPNTVQRSLMKRRSLMKPRINAKDISVLLKYHSKNDSGTYQRLRT